MNTASLQEIVESQKRIIQAQRAELHWLEALFSNPTMKPVDKLILWKTTPVEVRRGQFIEQPQEKKLYITKLAEEVGISSDTFGSRLQRIAETSNAVAYRREREISEDGIPVSRVYVAPTLALTEPQKIEIPPAGKTGAGHGGKRVKRCDSCGSHNLIETRQVICSDCGVPQGEKTHHLVNSPDDIIDQDATPQDDGSSLEQKNEPTFFCEPERNLPEYNLPLTPHLPPDFVETQEDEQPEIIPDRKMTDGDFSWEVFLQRRIGQGQTICSTGDVQQLQGGKYFSHPVGHELDIQKYLAGDKEHLYGSPLRCADGTTNVLTFDIDPKDSDHYAHMHEYMQVLADAGASPVAWLRREGSVHIELYFDVPVDAEAARTWCISVCPNMASIEECYPVNQKNKGRVSWPLYHRLKTFEDTGKTTVKNGKTQKVYRVIEDTVYECEAHIQLPGRNSYFTSRGIRSDKARLTELVAQAITPASLIAAMPQVEKERTQSKWLLDKPRGLPTHSTKNTSQSDGLAKIVIAEFNASTSWDELVDVVNNRFCAFWRGEETPSVVINKDGKSATDYGRTQSGRPECHDKYEIWLLAHNVNKRDDLLKRIREYEARNMRVSA